MTERTPRKIEIQKKKRNRAIPRAKLSRPQGNTPAVRKMLKRQAGKNRAAAAAAKA